MMATTTRRSGVVIPHEAKWYQRLAATLIYFLISCMAATLRFRTDDRSGFFQGTAPEKKFIFALWHNRLALSAFLYQRFVHKFAPDRRMAGLVSASRDGGLLAEILPPPPPNTMELYRSAAHRRGAAEAGA